MSLPWVFSFSVDSTEYGGQWSQRSETGQGTLGSKGDRGKYDMLYDVVCEVVLSSVMSGTPVMFIITDKLEIED